VIEEILQVFDGIIQGVDGGEWSSLQHKMAVILE